MEHHELAGRVWQRQAHSMCMATFPRGASWTAMVVALVHHSPDAPGRHETDAWDFLSSDPSHDSNSHIYAIDIIFRYYMTGGGGSAATTAGTAVPTSIQMFSDGVRVSITRGKAQLSGRGRRACTSLVSALWTTLRPSLHTSSVLTMASEGWRIT